MFEIITSSIFQINKHLFDILSLLSAIDVDLTKKKYRAIQPDRMELNVLCLNSTWTCKVTSI